MVTASLPLTIGVYMNVFTAISEVLDASVLVITKSANTVVRGVTTIDNYTQVAEIHSEKVLTTYKLETNDEIKKLKASLAAK